MNKWAEEIKKVEAEKESGRKEVSLAMIATNNHSAGFGPGTANLFRKMVGLSDLSWADQQHLQTQLEQRQQREKDQQVRKSNIPPNKYSKRRQSSLTEFIE
jgi:hypothetical protein